MPAGRVNDSVSRENEGLMINRAAIALTLLALAVPAVAPATLDNVPSVDVPDATPS